MKLALSTLLLSVAVSAPAIAQSATTAQPVSPTASMHPGGPHGPRGFGMFGPASHRVEPIANSPFSAQFTSTASFTDRDGKQVQRSSTSMVYRDSQGRVREEVTTTPPPPPPPPPADGATAPAPPAPPRGPRTMVTILDPVAHTITHLNAERQTAIVQTVPAEFFNRMQQREDRRASGEAPRRGRDNVTETDLGNKVFAGVPAKGEQTAITFPARDGGAAHTMTRQTWFSPDAKFVVSSSETTDRGTHQDTLTTFNKAEPNPSLFQVPAGYTTTSAPEDRFPGHRRGGPGGRGDFGGPGGPGGPQEPGGPGGPNGPALPPPPPPPPSM